MEAFWWILGIVAALLLIVLLITYICYRMAFYISDKEKQKNALAEIPPGEEYLPYRDIMVAWQQEVKTFPCEVLTVKSFDGLTLQGKYYERFPGATIELMFHGYRGSATRDLCGGVQRAYACGHNALIVDQRASGKSDGNVISFGINERKDCLSWLAFMISHFGPEVRIILTGISMGAATILMASGEELPPNVVGVLGDCGYTSPKEIICKVIEEDMKLPAKLAYPFVRLGARLFGNFDLEETDSLRALKKCRLPVFLVHGEVDKFVPCDMSRKMYENYSGKKRLYTVPGAGHCLAYIVTGDAYIKELKSFFG